MTESLTALLIGGIVGWVTGWVIERWNRNKKKNK